MEDGYWVAAGRSCSSARSVNSRPSSRVCASMPGEYNKEQMKASPPSICRIVGSATKDDEKWSVLSTDHWPLTSALMRLRTAPGGHCALPRSGCYGCRKWDRCQRLRHSMRPSTFLRPLDGAYKPR